LVGADGIEPPTFAV